MGFRKIACALGLCAGLAGSAQAQQAAPYPVVQGKNYKFQKIADGVYYATAEYHGTVFPFGSNPFFGANLVVIVNKDDVLIVDTGTSPAAARAFVADIKLLTDKPVRTVVNTHWHYDHTDGNSIFGPEVQIIAHAYVRHAIETFDILHNEPFKSSTRNAPQAMIDRFKKQVAEAKDPAQKAAAQKKLADTEAGAQREVSGSVFWTEHFWEGLIHFSSPILGASLVLSQARVPKDQGYFESWDSAECGRRITFEFVASRAAAQ